MEETPNRLSIANHRPGFGWSEAQIAELSKRENHTDLAPCNHFDGTFQDSSQYRSVEVWIA